jgi:hypothetical protein
MSYDPVVDEPRQGLWFRLLWMVLFYLLVFWGLSVIVAVVAIAQFVLVLVNGVSNGRLKDFSSALNRYAHQILQFITFNEERKPFPFSELPRAE